MKQRAKRYKLVTKRPWISADGEVLEKWITIGSATEVPRGGLICTLESIPTDKDWNYEFWIYPVESRWPPKVEPPWVDDPEIEDPRVVNEGGTDE